MRHQGRSPRISNRVAVEEPARPLATLGPSVRGTVGTPGCWQHDLVRRTATHGRTSTATTHPVPWADPPIPTMLGPTSDATTRCDQRRPAARSWPGPRNEASETRVGQGSRGPTSPRRRRPRGGLLPLLLFLLLFLADDLPAHVMSALRTNDVGRLGRAASGASLQLRSDLRVVRPATAGASVGLSSFGDCHNKPLATARAAEAPDRRSVPRNGIEYGAARRLSSCPPADPSPQGTREHGGGHRTWAQGSGE